MQKVLCKLLEVFFFSVFSSLAVRNWPHAHTPRVANEAAQNTERLKEGKNSHRKKKEKKI